MRFAPSASSGRAATRIRASLLVLSASAALSAGCESLDFLGSGGTSGGTAATGEIGVGRWHKSGLDCARGHCENRHELEVSKRGELSLEVYAPMGPSLPDFELALYQGRSKLASAAATGRSPRKLSRAVQPGTYEIVVKAAGRSDGELHYDLIAKIDGQETATASRPRPTPRPPPPPRATRKPPDVEEKPAPVAKEKAPAVPRTRVAAAEPPEVEPERSPEPAPLVDLDEADAARVDEGLSAIVDDTPLVTEEAEALPPTPLELACTNGTLVRAEVIDELTVDETAFVMIDAGTPRGIPEGIRGDLVDRREPIGTIEVVAVHASGSRARVIGTLSRKISLDTVAEICVPQSN
jgi:hypothetical protein